MKKTKFSIIIPVYNVSKYLRVCLDSVFNQTYSNYEVIIVCDKCDDNSEEIVDKYVNKYSNIKKIYAENTGLSIARNIGVTNSSGEYLLFLDSDDFFEKDLLSVLNNSLSDNPQVIRFQVQNVVGDNVIKYPEIEFDTTTGTNAFNTIIKYHYIENAWCYCYESEFYKKNNFQFMEHALAEDFGLIPLIIAKCDRIKSIKYIGYNYVSRPNSLMDESNYEKMKIKVNDILKQARFLQSQLKLLSNNNLFLMFTATSLITTITKLKFRDFRIYNKIVKKEGFYDYLLFEGFIQQIKHKLIKLNAFIFWERLR